MKESQEYVNERCDQVLADLLRKKRKLSYGGAVDLIALRFRHLKKVQRWARQRRGGSSY